MEGRTTLLNGSSLLGKQKTKNIYRYKWANNAATIKNTQKINKDF